VIEPAFLRRGHEVLILILILLVIIFLSVIFLLILLFFGGASVNFTRQRLTAHYGLTKLAV
jgi:hypothetical protein